jgi:hypothetical protein
MSNETTTKLVIINTGNVTKIKGLPFVGEYIEAVEDATINIKNSSGCITSIVKTTDGCDVTILGSRVPSRHLKEGTHTIFIGYEM